MVEKKLSIHFYSVMNQKYEHKAAQGNDSGVKSTDIIDFILKNEMPTNKLVTYANFVCDYKVLKSEPQKIRLVAGGDKLLYDEDADALAASLIEIKLLMNSVISEAKNGARLLSCDLKIFSWPPQCSTLSTCIYYGNTYLRALGKYMV